MAYNPILCLECGKELTRPARRGEAFVTIEPIHHGLCIECYNKVREAQEAIKRALNEPEAIRCKGCGKEIGLPAGSRGIGILGENNYLCMECYQYMQTAYWVKPPEPEEEIRCACCDAKITSHYFKIGTNGASSTSIILCPTCRYHPVCKVCGEAIHEVQCWKSIQITGRSQCRDCINTDKLSGAAGDKKKKRGHFIEWKQEETE